MKSGVFGSSAAAVVSTLAALGCCLPLGPFLLAAGSAGAAGFLLPLQPYLIAFAILMLAVGFVRALRARQCGQKQRALNVAVLLLSTGLVAAMLFGSVPAPAPAGQSAVASLELENFRQEFNNASDHTRVVALLSPT